MEKDFLEVDMVVNAPIKHNMLLMVHEPPVFGKDAEPATGPVLFSTSDGQAVRGT